MKRIIILFVLNGFATFLFAQNNFENYHSFGVFGQYSSNSHVADFMKLPGIPNCCTGFQNGSGSGINFGVSYEYAVFQYLSAQINADIASYSTDMKKSEAQKMSLKGAMVDGEFEHRLNANISAIEFEPMIVLRPTQALRINLGLAIGIPVKSTFTQEEVITKPDGQVTFLDSLGNNTGQFVRNQHNGDIPEASSLLLSLSGGFSYEFPLNKKHSMLLVPEINYHYGLSNISKNLKWTANSIRAGLSVVYSTQEYKEPVIIQPIDIDNQLYVLEPELEIFGNPDNIIYGTFNIKDNEIAEELMTSNLKASVKAVALVEGIENSTINFKVEEFMSSNMRPLLNFVFFDENSSVIPQRYVQLSSTDAKSFSFDVLKKESTIPTYHQILNIIGLRMSQDANSNVTLTGCNADLAKEKGNKDLSKKRAESIADYLTKVWNIEPSRIKIVTRNLPENNSATKEKEGQDENRRVEISSDSRQLLEPVITTDTLLKSNPPAIRFHQDCKSDFGIASWKLFAFQRDRNLVTYNGTGEPPNYIDWSVDKDKKTIPRLTEPVLYQMEIADKTGVTKKSKENELKIEQITIQKKRESKIKDFKIDYYSLILFQFNSSDFSPENLRIADFIKGRLKGNSEVKITGYTDQIGDDAYNMQLSEDRAKKLKRILTSKAYERGLGESELLFDNSLPEGRFYSRTVVVEVETPIEQ
ncbi:MAG: hypothetical protein HW421_2620 [Ignavibacteria bacterium]|nr:hypothetical protein [Ignavibacteria bacterium]